MNNRWILPEVQEELDVLKEHAIERVSENTHLNDVLSPNYVLIDAALWEDDISAVFENMLTPYRSLFRGSTGEELWNVAPYLVDISKDEEFVESIKEKDSITRRVTWLSSSLDIDALRKHLRRFLRMKKEDGSYMYFRFYDPFVISSVFPNLTPEQSADFFNDIDYIIADDVRIGKRYIFYMSSEQKMEIKHQTL